MFAHTPSSHTPRHFRSGIDALRLKLWDEERGCPRGLPGSPRAPAAATDVEEPL